MAFAIEIVSYGTMKATHLLAASAALSALLIFAASRADAQVQTAGGGQRFAPISSSSGGPRIVPIGDGGGLQRGRRGFHGHHHGGKGFGGFGGVWIVEREVPVIVEREVVREVPVAPPPPPPPPRKPWVLGKSYASLPGGCMKWIEEGVSYYGCSGEWYRQVGSGSNVTYKAVGAP